MLIVYDVIFLIGNTVPAVFAIPAANRPGFTGYFIPTPPTAYRNQAWMPYAGENELPGQWADSVSILTFLTMCVSTQKMS